ncbi:MAG: 30S ribosomal protein S3 [Nitrospirae bacterium]|nr:30S ribosomal protein S3 [Nitrospirota bacterium]MBF0518356.1 30S ribosomal protein S3 [Nitrospirota bacterium]MBF0534266.1 30S ribosomal protein S3 [Nitrospirota bacterium]MBF0615753.1 30S ribosomal protein S3 [Nitrospirota bacterium]
MGQKTHPIGNRLGIIKTWDSKWYSKSAYAQQLHEDLKLQQYIKEKLYHSGISKVEIERAGQKIKIIIHTARPGIIIGKKGIEVENLKKAIESSITKQVSIDIKEIRKPELDAQLVAENIGMQIEKRVAYRRAMKKSVLSSIRFGALGVKIACAGRLSGAEIARTEWYKEGRVPLHTFRADIDYGTARAKTTYGIIGVKVWIYKGDVLPETKGAA